MLSLRIVQIDKKINISWDALHVFSLATMQFEVAMVLKSPRGGGLNNPCTGMFFGYYVSCSHIGALVHTCVWLFCSASLSPVCAFSIACFLVFYFVCL